MLSITRHKSGLNRLKRDKLSLHFMFYMFYSVFSALSASGAESCTPTPTETTAVKNHSAQTHETL